MSDVCYFILIGGMLWKGEIIKSLTKVKVQTY